MPESEATIHSSSAEVVEVERRIGQQLKKLGDDLSDFKGMLHSSIESARLDREQVNRRLVTMEQTAEKYADRNRLTWLGVMAAIAGGIGIIQYLERPSDEERADNKRRIEKLEDAGIAVATTRYTRQDHDDFADKVAEELAEVESRSIDRKRDLAETVERRLMHLDEHVESLREELHNHQKDGHHNSVLARVAELESRLRDIHAELGERGDWMRQTDIERASLAATNAARIEEMQRELREISLEQRRRTSRVYETE